MTAAKGDGLGWQLFIGDKVKARLQDAVGYNKIVIRARGLNNATESFQMTLIDVYGIAYSATIQLTQNMQDIEISLMDFRISESLLLPRPYPGFLPLTFTAGEKDLVFPEKMDKLEVTIDSEESIEIQRIYLSKE